MYKIFGLVLSLVLLTTALSVGAPEAESPMISTSCAASVALTDASVASFDCPPAFDWCAAADLGDRVRIWLGEPVTITP